MKTTRFKMQVQKRKKPPVDREELKLYWKGIIDLGVRELIVDNFAGGGGASTGIEEATGESVDVAINHDPDSISMHKANHPDTVHYCESVWDVDPRDIARGRPVGLVWLSPDCKHFSKAKGSKPVEKSIRGLAWVAVRWAATVKPRCIILENVEEFRGWGPLTADDQPDPKQKGRTFNSFVNALRAQGYEVEWQELRACDYGAPTIRKRLFLIAKCDGLPIVWPEPSHGDPKKEQVKISKGILKPWRAVSEVIDWSIPCTSIFTRKQDGKKELADNTKRRIARGMFKFIINNPNPFIAPFIINYKFTNEPESVNSPLSTITTVNNHYIVTPFIARIGQTGFNPDGNQYSLNDPLSTIVTKQEHLLVSAFLAQYHTETDSNNVRGQSLNEPMLTQDTSNRYGIVTSNLVKMRGKNIGQPVTDPLHTITAGGNHHAEVRAFLVAYYGASIGQTLDSPIGTIPTHDRFGLVMIYGTLYQIIDIGFRMLEPHELYAAQGFPKSYIIKGYLLKNGKKVTKSKQVARCGNSVSPPMSKALVKANLPHMCIGSGKKLSFERYKETTGQLQMSL